ncbi:MAG: hypothetical protein KGJ43_07430, partial [Acidobacteriota bacterium]|nr:hypothetical protein [Acidobacteriota bacterium]
QASWWWWPPPHEESSPAGSGGDPAPALTEIPLASGEHGFPYDAVPPPSGVPGAPKLNTTTLSEAGYVEREFKMSGGATVYGQSGFWSSNGQWGVSVAQSNVPYTTRLIVRYPTNPARFNGTVVFEWLNDTTGGDQDPVFSEMGEELIRHGFAYVAVTAQRAGMSDLATWDPLRYGGLSDSGDGQSYSIFTQAAEAVRAHSATLLGGLTPKKLIGTGDSQSAFRIDTYVNAIQPVTHAFDAFIAIGRAVTAAPLGNGLIATSPFPAQIRTDNTAPFIQLNTQGDIVELDAAAARQPDNGYLRTWELPGASHIDAHEGSYEVETIARENPTVPVPQCIFGTPIEGTGTPLDGVNQVNNMPLFEVEDAALMDMQRWIVNGVAAPHASPISTTPVFFGLYDLVNSNQYGVGFGGVRLPETEVPTETYSVINFAKPGENSLNPASLIGELQAALEAAETGSIGNPELRDTGLCLLSGYFNNLASSTLRGLYPTSAGYAARYDAEVSLAESAGFITPDDAAAAIANADAGFGSLQQPLVSIP